MSRRTASRRLAPAPLALILAACVHSVSGLGAVVGRSDEISDGVNSIRVLGDGHVFVVGDYQRRLLFYDVTLAHPLVATDSSTSDYPNAGSVHRFFGDSTLLAF